MTNPPLSLKFAFLISLKPQIEVVVRADVSENRLPETKNNFSDYNVSQRTGSVSLSVPSRSLAVINSRALSSTPMHSHQLSCTLVNSQALSSTLMHSRQLSCTHQHSCTLINSHTLSSTLIISSTLMHSHQLSCTLINTHALSSTLINSHALPLTPERSHQL